MLTDCNIFHKWHKDTCSKVVEVKVDGTPTNEDPKTSNQSVLRSRTDKSCSYLD